MAMDQSRGLMRATGMMLTAVLLFFAPVGEGAPLRSNADVRAAIDLADHESYEAARALVGADKSPLIQWIELRKGDADWQDYQTFTKRYGQWPSLKYITRLAEPAMWASGSKNKRLEPLFAAWAQNRVVQPYAKAAEITAWFQGRDPQTGLGALAYAFALEAQGDAQRAQEVMVQAWLDLPFEPQVEAQALLHYKDAVSSYHLERINRLLWRERTQEARAVLDLVSEGIADADRKRILQRISYLKKSKTLPYPEADFQNDLTADAGLAYSYTQWLISQGRDDAASALVLEMSQSTRQLEQPFRWSGWRRYLARRAMRAGQPQLAYKLASQHFLSTGFSFGDLEWLSGYLALRYLNQPQAAISHFKTLSVSGASPQVIGRASYWLARSYDKVGDTEQAQFSYQIAAAHQSSFYGQLAAEHLGLPLPQALIAQHDDIKADGPIFEQPVVRAAFALMDAGHPAWAGAFFAHLGQSLTASEIASLTKALEQQDQAYFALVLGKSAARVGVVVADALFPIHPLADRNWPVDAALALAIARQESAFQTNVGSRVGAQGLMQLMPATAKEVSGELKIPYSLKKLKTDWRYNARLGTQYLSTLEQKFGPSPVLIASGYNAGPGRTDIWIDEFGDPRLGAVDMIDWIEHMPFRETRGYVFKVLEAIPIYHARLGPKAPPLNFSQLLRGEKPILRPVFRPEDVSAFEGEER